MTVKPQFQILLMAGAMVLAGALSYGILRNNAETETGAIQEAPVVLEKFTPQPPLADAVFYDVKGNPRHLSDFKGHVVLVNLWATWCTPCVVELPALEKLQAKLRDKKFSVVAISIDRDAPEKIQDFLKSKGIEQLDFYHDRDRQMPAKWQYAGIPTSFLIDGEGNVLHKFDGPYEWDEGSIFEAINKLTQ